ncbi:ankyrin repeat-containing domain protein [Xylaria castorea]|nr:ankyrin repeat-containing domain protein [Xylaria castorea]
MSLALCLPIELLYYISKSLDDPADLSSWSRSCRGFHAALTPLLYHNVKDDPVIICWACDQGRLDTVQRLLDAGANPNVAWAQNEPRWWTLRDLAQPDEDIIPSLRLEGSRSPSPQPEEDSTLSHELQELLSQRSQRERHRVKFGIRVSEWLMSHAAIEHKMTVYFHEDSYAVADDDADGVAELDLLEEDDMEPRPWPARYHWNPYNSVKTFPQRCYWTPLHIAAAWGNDKLVNLLLDNGADINTLSRLFCKCATLPDRWVAPLWTPLHTSMCHGHESTTRLLLSRGASTYVMTRYRGRDKRRYTALHSACTVDLLDAARTLVDGGYQTDVTIRDHKKLTPLAYAFFQGSWPIIDFLLEHGVDINAGIGPLNALGHACLLGYYAEALRLLDLGATPQCKSSINGEPPFYFHLIAVAGAPDFPSARASKQKKFRLELVNRLIKYGIDVNQRGVDGVTALMEAASFHRTDVVKALFHSGADVRTSDHGLLGICALEKAISLNSKESQKTPKGAMLNTVQALLEAMAETPAPRLVDIEAVGPNTNESDTTDDLDISSAFRMICSTSHKHEDKLEVVDLLLKYNRPVEIANVEPNLVYASILGTNFNISNMLLENGFNQPCEKHFENLIMQFLDDDVAEGLCHIMNHFPDTAPQISNGQLLYDAIDTGSKQCAEFLINEGVSINSRNEDGSSLLFAACTMGDTLTAEVLLKRGADPDECTREGDPLTAVAALDQDRDMVRLLLDYGASIHSSPPGKLTRHAELGFLDIAISCGLLDAVEEIVNHKNFGSPTDEEISRHWHTIIKVPSLTSDMGFMLELLLGSKGFDENQVFTIIPGSLVLTTPLHSCAASSFIVDRTETIETIECLINNGADIHKRLLARPNSQNHTLKPESNLKGMEFEGTTPLEWAISFSSVRVVRAMLEEEVLVYGRFLSPKMEKTKTTRMELMLLYAKAACCRQKPRMFSLLFKKGLDPAICDEDGNTIIHMICDYVETFWPNDEPEWTMECIAERSAFSLIACLKWGNMCHLKNEKGESGMDRVLQILKYSGNCEFHQTLAKHWHEKIDYVEGSSPELIAKFDALDDSDDEEESDDEESDGDASDEEQPDEGLDTDNEMSDNEPNLNE